MQLCAWKNIHLLYIITIFKSLLERLQVFPTLKKFRPLVVNLESIIGESNQGHIIHELRTWSLCRIFQFPTFFWILIVLCSHYMSFTTMKSDWGNARNSIMFIQCPNLLWGVMVVKWDNNSVGNARVNVFGNAQWNVHYCG